MKTLANISRRRNQIIIGGIFIISIVIFSSLAKNVPLNFDEAYNLQVPVSLLRGQGYNTIYRLEPFDGLITITTGPIVLVPTFLVLKFFGVGVLRARLIQVIYISVLLVMFWILSARHYRYLIGACLLLLLFSSKYLFDYGIPVMGELPAMAFVFSGLVLWDYRKGKYKKLAIFIMGFSVLAKSYFALIVVSIVFVETVRFLKAKFIPFEYTKELFWLFLLFFFPLGVWETVKLFSLGMENHKSYIQESIQFANNQNYDFATIFSLSPDKIPTVLERISLVIEETFPNLPVAIIIIILVGIFLRFTQIIFQKNKLEDDSSVLLLSTSIFTTYFLWFLFISANGWWRYFFPFTTLCIFLLGDLIYFSYEFAKGRQWFHYFVLIAIGAGVCFYVVSSLLRQYDYLQKLNSPNQLIAQREFSKQISKYHEQGYDICVFGWWQAPEISFLAGGIKFSECSACQYKKRRTVIIYTTLQEDFDPQGAASSKSCLGQQLAEGRYGKYFLYEPANSIQ